MFNATAVYVRDPFHPMSSREVRHLPFPGPLSALAPETRQPFILLRNGEAVLRADWNQPVEEGDVIAVVMLPQGGGGGGGSNPLKTVLMLAVTVFAPGIGNAIAGTWGNFLGIQGITWSSVIGGAVGMLGSALVNALIPNPPAPNPNGGAQANYASASPTYNLSAQGNAARLNDAIPNQYGRLKVYPDFAAQPYVEYAGNEQYLYQLLCIGRGEYDIESINIEDTPISSFGEITYEIVPPNGTLNLFPAAVATSVEVSGQEALTGTTLGPFVVNAATTVSTRLAIDVVCPRGLYYANDSGGLDSKTITWKAEAQQIDDYGTAIGAWFTLGNETLSAATTTPLRSSYSYSVPSGRYQVRLTRTDTKDTSSRAGHELDWAGLRSYLVSGQTFGNVTLLALRMQATNNLSGQASRKINVICTRKLPIWNGTSWSSSTVATRSIAWAIADACKTIGLPDSRIDLDALLDLDAVWTARGDTFDGRFDQFITFWEAITKIAQVGRGKPYMQGGIIHVVRDQAQTLPVALFSMRNIVRGSFSLEFIVPTDDTADAVQTTYFDQTSWTNLPVLAKLPDSVAATPAKVELFGCVSRDQAYREGLYMAAVNRYRRTIIRFSTEMEGFIPSYGDPVAIAHDLPQWGQCGEIVAWNAATNTATLSEPLTWQAGQTHYIGLRKRDGSISGPYVATAGVDAYHVVLGTSPDFILYTGGNEERTHFTFGWGETWRQLGRVVSATPRSATQVDIVAINEDPSVHTADQGAVAPPVNSSQLPATLTAPVVSGLVSRSMTGYPDKMLLSWQPAPGADHYLIEQSADGETWTRTGEPTASNYTATALYGASTIVRVAAVGLTRGPWVQISYGLTADYMWTGDTNLMWAGDTNLMWRY